MKLIQTTLVAIITVSFLCLESGCQEFQKSLKSQETLIEETKTSEQPQPNPQPEPKSQPKPQPQAQTQKGAPVIQVENPTHDFGEVGPDKKYNCEFRFKNVGDVVLKIERVQSTCGCAIAKLKKKQYKPGESGSIKVAFHTPQRQGKTSKHLYIHNNDKKNSRFELTIKAKVVLKVAVNPKKLDLSLKAENAGISPITIRSKDEKLFSIKSIVSANKVITADFDPTVKSTEFVLVPKVDMEALKKRLRGAITIGLTHPDTKQVIVSFAAKPLFKVTHPRLIVRGAEPGKPIMREASVISNYGDTFEIESISTQKQYIKVLSQERADNNSVKFELQITPPSQTGKVKYFTDQLTIKIKDNSELMIRLTGMYKTD